MTAPKIGERHKRIAEEINFECLPVMVELNEKRAAEILAAAFPEDDSWVERAAEEIMRMSTIKTDSSLWEKKHRRIIEIINGCRRG